MFILVIYNLYVNIPAPIADMYIIYDCIYISHQHKKHNTLFDSIDPRIQKPSDKGI